METTGTKAREAFDAAAAGERIGFFTYLNTEFADELYECFRGLNVTERMDVQVIRMHQSLELKWGNGGRLFVSPDADDYRGMVLDRCYVPECMDFDAYETVRPTLATSGRKLDRYDS